MSIEETKVALDEAISRFYRDAVAMRAKILSEQPRISQQQYEIEIYKMLVPFQTGLLNAFSRRLGEQDYLYLYRGLDQVVFRVLAMPTRSDLCGAE